MFKSILVPLDGSPESNEALPTAQALARQTGASVTLLRVLPWPAASEHREATAEARTKLDRTAAELADSGIRAEPALRHGDAADEILEQCRAQNADLILMRTHARAGLERAVLGSVTQRVLHEARVPVMMLRAGDRPIGQLRTLLVPVDGSPGGAVGLGMAVRLARSTGAALKLLQVSVPLSMQVYAAYEYGGLAYFDPDWDEEALSAARTYVESLAKRVRESGIGVDGQAQMAPDVARTIVEVAHSSVADLIVMSTQALTGPARALLGSVADAVVRTADCPVLLVHRTALTKVGEQTEPDVPALATS
jgi:nucleotide-binding universal stress UspA family protein